MIIIILKWGIFFVGVLCAVALFLFSYRGYNEHNEFYRNDGFICNLAGVFALGVAFFPMTITDIDISLCRVLFQNSTELVGSLHYVFASLLFITLAYISLVIFTKSKDISNATTQKLERNKVYKLCGWTIVLAILLIVLEKNINFLHQALKGYKPVFIF